MSKKTVSKPKKPYPEFPLFAHANGQWAKKIKGRMYYFGPWNDPDSALQTFRDQVDQIHLGITADMLVSGNDEVDVRYMCNVFLDSKKDDIGKEITQRSFNELMESCKRLVEFFSANADPHKLKPSHFTMLRKSFPDTWGLSRTAREIRQIRSIFNYCVDEEIIGHLPNMGRNFRPPSKKALRLHRQSQDAEHGLRLFEPHEVKSMYDKAGTQWKSLILLAVNAGFGNTDLGRLTSRHLDLEGGWVSYSRPKTGIFRRASLWKETVDSLKDSIAKRPAPLQQGDDQLVFLTEQGRPYVRMSESGKPIDTIVGTFTRMLKRWKMHQTGRGFYSLRRTFRTLAAGAKDKECVDFIMGHAEESMGEVYTQRVEDERLIAVAEFVRKRIFPVLALLLIS